MIETLNCPHCGERIENVPDALASGWCPWCRRELGFELAGAPVPAQLAAAGRATSSAPERETAKDARAVVADADRAEARPARDDSRAEAKPRDAAPAYDPISAPLEMPAQIDLEAAALPDEALPTPQPPRRAPGWFDPHAFQVLGAHGGAGLWRAGLGSLLAAAALAGGWWGLSTVLPAGWSPSWRSAWPLTLGWWLALWSGWLLLAKTRGLLAEARLLHPESWPTSLREEVERRGLSRRLERLRLLPATRARLWLTRLLEELDGCWTARESPLLLARLLRWRVDERRVRGRAEQGVIGACAAGVLLAGAAAWILQQTELAAAPAARSCPCAAAALLLGAALLLAGRLAAHAEEQFLQGVLARGDDLLLAAGDEDGA